MARRKRIQDPGLLRHVISRGNGRMKIFLEPSDYRKFLYVLADVCDTYEIECWDYCVMPNHYHLALRNLKPNFSSAMQHLNGEYATWWNATHERVGHVFQGRFKDQIVQEERYLRTLVRYIGMNPVRAGLVTHPEQWQWSGYRCIAGLQTSPSFVACEHVLCRFGNADVVDAREGYVRHVLAASDDEESLIDRFRSREAVIGDTAFKRTVCRGVARFTQHSKELDLWMPGMA
jgi:REP element-mobilizing transposase RayT